jgi:glycosyltransferase involved in cell wall biosynthesis
MADFGEIGRQRFLWMHDIDVRDQLTAERARRFTGIFALSEPHKAHLLGVYPFLDPARVFVTRNGLDLTRFDQTVDRKNQRLIYSSSPDRGLDILLKIFPKIRERCPDATLDVFHGWAGFDRTARRNHEQRAFRERLIKLLDQPGVIHHGYVDQSRLAREMLGSALWVYPTYFTETSCITAMEAQAAGAIPVTRPLAALAETVKFGVLIDGDVQTSEVQARYVEEIVSLLQQPKKQDQIREDMVPWARAAFGWDDVAAEWRRLFTSNATRLDQHDAGTLIVEAGWQTTMTDTLAERVLL